MYADSVKFRVVHRCWESELGLSLSAVNWPASSAPIDVRRNTSREAERGDVISPHLHTCRGGRLTWPAMPNGQQQQQQQQQQHD